MRFESKLTTWSPRVATSHPSGISPSSESTSRSGKRSAISFGSPVSRPSVLAHGVEIDEPGLEQRPRHRLQRRVHPPVQLDLVVQRAEDVGDGALLLQWWPQDIERGQVTTAICRKPPAPCSNGTLAERHDVTANNRSNSWDSRARYLALRSHESKVTRSQRHPRREHLPAPCKTNDCLAKSRSPANRNAASIGQEGLYPSEHVE